MIDIIFIFNKTFIEKKYGKYRFYDFFLNYNRNLHLYPLLIELFLVKKFFTHIYRFIYFSMKVLTKKKKCFDFESNNSVGTNSEKLNIF